VKPPSGATFMGLMIGDASRLCLIASDAGYGFITKMENLVSKNKAGKALLNLPKGAKVLSPVPVDDIGSSEVVAITNEGRMLMFKLSELPELAKGKGNKIIGIPSARVAERVEYVAAIAVMHADQVLVIHSGKRHFNLSMNDLEHYRGERGRRGNKLPQGFRKVDSVVVQDK